MADWPQWFQNANRNVVGVLGYLRFNIKTFVVYIVHDHVHAAQVVGSRIHFLTVKKKALTSYFGYTQQRT
jgi:hypothetical protein